MEVGGKWGGSEQEVVKRGDEANGEQNQKERGSRGEINEVGGK